MNPYIYSYFTIIDGVDSSSIKYIVFTFMSWHKLHDVFVLYPMPVNKSNAADFRVQTQFELLQLSCIVGGIVFSLCGK